MGKSSAAATKIVTEDERVQVVRKMYVDADQPKHMYRAMRHNFTFNYRVQALGRTMEPSWIQLFHMSLITDAPDDIADDCRVLGIASFGTDKAARKQQEKGVTRHKNPHLCAFAAAAYQLAWTNDVRGKEVISYIRHASDPDRRASVKNASGQQVFAPIWTLRHLVFGNDAEELGSQNLFQKDWKAYPTSAQVRKQVCYVSA